MGMQMADLPKVQMVMVGMLVLRVGCAYPRCGQVKGAHIRDVAS